MEDPPASLYDLPDGPLSIILKTLMAIDPTTLVGVVARLGARLPTLCRNNITLKLNRGWYVDRKNGVTYEDCIAGVSKFRWAQSLDVTGFNEQRVIGTSMAVLAAGCPHLTTLNVSCCGKLTDAAIAALAAGCPQLATINAPWCSLLTDTGIIEHGVVAAPMWRFKYTSAILVYFLFLPYDVHQSPKMYNYAT